VKKLLAVLVIGGLCSVGCNPSGTNKSNVGTHKVGETSTMEKVGTHLKEPAPTERRGSAGATYKATEAAPKATSGATKTTEKSK
jgi:hypothetical protein